MKYSVIHSNDPYLLARMATDLQMSKLRSSDMSIEFDWCNPFDSRYIRWMYINELEAKNIFGFANHDCSCTSGMVRHELTESNYLQVLESVLS